MTQAGTARCPFSATLISEQNACRFADHVVRRGGSEIDCNALTAHARCMQLFEGLKQVALPAFGVDDDLLNMPHSVLQKVQYGGLAAIHHVLHKGRGEAITDIAALVEEAQNCWPYSLPYADFVPEMLQYKLRRRS